ncbi:MAG: SufD family Fe-S cluster assembly protein [Candidatus Altiarchaeota archaeon]|nr:SufD family Fe-S cluster assembly protein [Candidatus Altiarchaeota archaeon]
MDLKDMLKAYELSGGKPEELTSDAASIVVGGNQILSLNTVEGLSIEERETESGVEMKLVVKKGYRIQKPIHLCFGVLPKEGLQEINAEVVVEEDASADIKACCTFPNARRVKHVMDGKFILKKNASLTYRETHYHGPYGGIEVVPRARILVGVNSMLQTVFSLTTGRVGKLDIDYEVDAGKNSKTEIHTKVYGKKDDVIKIREGVRLNGVNARSVIKSRIAVRDNAISDVVNITEGNAPYTRGHVDCTEIIRDDAKAKAIPVVSVANEKAKVTHEAAIGTVDKKELETLMAHGLDKNDAIDLIIEGLLR